MTKTILLADDSVTIQKVVELTFMDEDCSVVAVSNGSQALTKLAEMTPDLVIADIHMPGADGYEVCRQVKAARPRVPVLLLVGTFEPFEAADVTAAGADGYLKKPFDSQELLRRVNELLTRGPVAVPPPAAAPAVQTETLKLDLQTLASGAEPPWAAPAPPPPAPAAAPTPLPAWEVRAPEPVAPAPPAEEIATGWEMAPEEPEPAPAPQLAPAVPMPVAPPPTAAEPEPAAAAAGDGQLSDADVDRIARRVIELMGDHILREVAWEVVPDLAEVVLKARIRELESQVD